MGFGKKKNRFARTAIKVLMFVLVAGGIGGGGFMMYQKQINTLKTGYEAQIEAMELESYSLKRQVWTAKEDLPAGTTLKEEMLQQTQIKSDLPAILYLETLTEGMTLKVDAAAGLPLMGSMVTREAVAADLREAELNMLRLPTDLRSGEVLDVRICLPDGQDFIVLSKKPVRQLKLEQNTLWLWLSEKEILTLDSAIVDTYLHPGTKLYTVNYVEPAIQQAAIATYPINEAVRQVMMSDPNILEKAKTDLAQGQRKALEDRLAKLAESDLQQVAQGVSAESQKSQAAVDQNRQEALELADEAQPEVKLQPEASSEAVSDAIVPQAGVNLSSEEEVVNDAAFY